MEKIDFARYIANLAPEKQARLASQLPPLSFAQQRLWFLDQLEPDSFAYNVPTTARLVGRLDVAALQQSLDEIVRRHEALRTIFVAVEDQPYQVILPPQTLPLAVIDLCELPQAERETEVQRLSTGQVQQPFDLTHGPLIRVRLLHLTGAGSACPEHSQEKQAPKGEYVFLLTVHHIVYDGWSAGVFMRELGVLYEAFSRGKPSPLPELPIQYADLARWQRQWLQGEVLETQLSYWKQQLGDSPPVLALPTDRPRPAVQTFQGAIKSFTLPGALLDSLNTLSQREGVTLFMVLLAAFQTLLYRYTGQDDISVGTPISGRNQAETEQLIGVFINVLVLRTDLAGNPTFRELLARVRNVCLGAYAHQDLPFEMLVEELRLQRRLSHAPLFQVMCVLQNYPISVLELPELTLIPQEIDPGASKYDVSIDFLEGDKGLVGLVEFNTDLFNADTIERLMRDLVKILEDVARDTNVRINDVELYHGLSLAEKVEAEPGDFVFQDSRGLY